MHSTVTKQNFRRLVSVSQLKNNNINRIKTKKL